MTFMAFLPPDVLIVFVKLDDILGQKKSSLREDSLQCRFI
jgi:hypothetical protein